MANNYFQFKKFTVYQDSCAMKVTTDACLFGAITATVLRSKDSNKILDIGTGTGLLSLMYAQQNPGAILDAVEIDEAAAIQAGKNIAESIFASQVNVHFNDIKLFGGNNEYDFIFTNPPFFENDLKSSNDFRNKALHGISLTLDEVITQIDRLLKPEGSFSILLPFHRANTFITLAGKRGWHCSKRINIKQTERHDFFRSILSFDRQTNIPETISLIIKKSGEYGEDFKKFLKAYYLFL